MSPEQIAGKEVTQKSDIYSLGLLLYEIFTGKQAFEADSIPELLEKQTNDTLTTLSDIIEGIDPQVENIITQCLEKTPPHRPESALQVAMRLPGGNPLQVALEAGEITYIIPIRFAVTFDTTSFYFPTTVLVFAVALIIAIYSYYISIAGQPIFGKGFLEDE